MTFSTRPVMCSAAIVALCILVPAIPAQTSANCNFTYFQINPANNEEPETHPLGINSYGSVVGQAIDDTGTYPPRGFTRFSNGSVSYVNPTGSISAELSDRNDSGAMVGDYSTHAPYRISFLLQGSTMTTIAHPGADTSLGGTLVHGINKYSNIVGYYFDSHESPHGFKRFTNGSFMSIAYPKAIGTMPNSINSSGWIAGSYNDANHGLHGFIYKNGVYAKVDYPNTTATELFGISDAGVVIGIDHSLEQGRAFLYKNGKFEVISAPNAYYTHATGIAPNGLITGEVVYNGQASTLKGFTATCE